jgi:catechol 2,3-dioxygenase-like lactoylglutathione lyase family enzyme
MTSLQPDSDRDVTDPSVLRTLLPPPVVNHIAVQTVNLDNSIAWYRDFFGCETNWSLSEFSPLTSSRLPGIGTLVEMACGSVRFHLFDRQGAGTVSLDKASPQYQHICLQAGSSEELNSWRAHWLLLFQSGRYTYVTKELPTDVVKDDDGVESFYFYDVNGLEFEFTNIPGGQT